MNTALQPDLAEAYIDKMPCSTFEIYVYSEVKKAFIAGWKAKTNEYNQGAKNTNL